MSGPERALQAGLVGALVADVGVQALLGAPARVYDEPPPDVVSPYLTIGRVECEIQDADGGPGFELIVHLHAWSRFGGRSEAQEVIAASRAALHDADPVLDGWRLINLRATYADVFRAGDGRTSHGILRLRAVVEPLGA